MAAYCLTDTIYALSSGAGKGGVAVVRVSGKKVREILKAVACLEAPKARYAYFRALKDAQNETIDNALVLFFEAPHSFTGEDVAEFQVHGGSSVIEALFKRLSTFNQTRPAERGEFSRRAVVNDKMDLTQAEGIMDLIDAQTERQRKQALLQTQGALGKMYQQWRETLVKIMAYCEAFIDFPEEDIPPSEEAKIAATIQTLITKIKAHLDDNARGQKLREGFQIVLIGEPNVGKSSLMNAFTKKETAIVTPIAGTTRDVVEAHLDVAGFPVIIADTAGLRESTATIEAEGIRRAIKRAEDADLVLHVQDISTYPILQKLPESLAQKPCITIWNKADKNPVTPEQGLAVSALTGDGIAVVWEKVTAFLKEHYAESQSGVITRERYRVALKEACACLQAALSAEELELRAEDLRMAARHIGRITGQIETDELLDVIFRDFCIGK